MRDLTPDETLTRSRRRAGFQQFYDERCPVLLELAENLAFERSDRIVLEPWLFLANLDVWFGSQAVTIDSRPWAIVRLGYWIGEALAVKYEGSWFLNEIPDSRYFLHYVVGRFKKVPINAAMLAPMDVAHQFLLEPPGRSLSKLMMLVCAELEHA
jgi:hypothetical protein